MVAYNINDINPYILVCGEVNKNNCPPAGTEYGKRRVKWHEVELITWGEGRIITEGKSLPTRKGDLFLRRPGMEVQGIAPYHCFIIVFDLVSDPDKKELYGYQDFFSDMGNVSENADAISKYGNFCGLNFPEVYRTDRYEELSQLFLKAYREWIYQKKDSGFLVRTVLMQILMCIYEELNQTGHGGRTSRSLQINRPKVLSAKTYIDDNIGKRFTLAELADIAGLSRNFFCRVFTEITGETPINYINAQKINAAKKMLIETNCTVKEIAYKYGFDNETYFYTLFKRSTGLSPLEYRQIFRSVYQVC